MVHYSLHGNLGAAFSEQSRTAPAHLMQLVVFYRVSNLVPPGIAAMAQCVIRL
jgi:hypothetical protein